jgi:hypothetical protein
MSTTFDRRGRVSPDRCDRHGTDTLINEVLERMCSAIMRGYERAHPDEVKDGQFVESNNELVQAQTHKLSPRKAGEIGRLAAQAILDDPEMKIIQIAKKLRCSADTVSKVRKKLREEGKLK